MPEPFDPTRLSPGAALCALWYLDPKRTSVVSAGDPFVLTLEKASLVVVERRDDRLWYVRAHRDSEAAREALETLCALNALDTKRAKPAFTLYPAGGHLRIGPRTGDSDDP